MRLFVEGAIYDKSYLEECFGEIYARITRKVPQSGGLMLDAIGYYFNRKHHCPYFVLPKVFAKIASSGEFVLFEHLVVDQRSAVDISIKSVSKQLKALFDPGLKVEVLYNLTPDHVFFRQTERGVVCKQLRALKGNYYNDNLQKLWKLLYSFHKRLSDIHGNKTLNDYLLIKDFNVVFEDMIDELISDDHLPPRLKAQKDGKVVDHLFHYESLPIQSERVYYVGETIDGVMSKTFRRLIGKIFCPYKESSTLIMALEKGDVENEAIYNFAKQYFSIHPYVLGK